MFCFLPLLLFGSSQYTLVFVIFVQGLSWRFSAPRSSHCFIGQFCSLIDMGFSAPRSFHCFTGQFCSLDLHSDIQLVFKHALFFLCLIISGGCPWGYAGFRWLRVLNLISWRLLGGPWPFARWLHYLILISGLRFCLVERYWIGKVRIIGVKNGDH